MDIEKENRFDGMLKKGLHEHEQPVPADFTMKVLRRIWQEQEKEILNRVVFQERLALAGCIFLGGTVIVLAVLFASFGSDLIKQIWDFSNKILQTGQAVNGRGQLYIVLLLAFTVAAYSLLEVLAGEN